MKKTPKAQHIEAMAAALFALADRPAEISAAQLDTMSARLGAYAADGWARSDRLRCGLLGLACGVLVLSAVAGVGVVLAAAVKAVVTMVKSGAVGAGVAVVPGLLLAVAFTALVIWGGVKADARHTRASMDGDEYRRLKDNLWPLRGWSLTEAEALANRTPEAQALYAAATAQLIGLRTYHLHALQRMAAKAGCRCACDDDYPGSGPFGALIVIVDLALVIGLVAATVYHCL